MKRIASMMILSAGAILPYPAAAQSEAALKNAFEGKRVTLKIEMPATKDGIDIAVGSAAPIDYRAYSSRIKRSGTALRPDGYVNLDLRAISDFQTQGTEQTRDEYAAYFDGNFEVTDTFKLSAGVRFSKEF